MTNRAAWHRANHPGKAVKARSKNSITFDNGDGSDTTICTIAPLHKGSGPYAQADELDTEWQTTTGAWDYEIQTLDFLVQARDTFNVGNIFQFTDPASGEWVQFDPQSLNWVDENYSRQQIAIKQAVAAVANDYKLEFPAAWGAGRHFTYEATCSRLNKVITIDSAANLPAVTLLGNTIHLEAEFSLATSSGVDIYIDGVLWDKANNVRYTTANRIDFKDAATGQQILWWLNAVEAWDSGDDNRTFGELECRRQGGPGNLFITIRIPKSWIDAATFPIYIDPTTVYTATSDGSIVSTDTGNSWDAAHDATSGTTTNTTDLFVRSRDNGSTVNINRAVAPMDTSSIPDGDTISAATFNAYYHALANGDDDGDDWVTIVQCTLNDPTVLDAADFDVIGDAIDNPTEGIDSGERKDISSISTSAYTVFTLNATGISWISKTGYTELGLREGHDVIDSRIADNTVNSAIAYTSEQTGTSQDPYLEITHSGAGRTTKNTRPVWLGVAPAVTHGISNRGMGD